MSLAVPCALTIVVETLILAICGYRDRLFLLLVVFVNAATNLALNLALPLIASAVDITYLIYPLEAIVVVLEYALYALALSPSRRLFLMTLAANAASYTLGIVLFGHV